MVWLRVLRALISTIDGGITLVAGLLGIALNFYGAYQSLQGSPPPLSGAFATLWYLSGAAFLIAGGRVIYRVQGKLIVLDVVD
jgi:hypothetical protein